MTESMFSDACGTVMVLALFYCGYKIIESLLKDLDEQDD